MEISNFEKSFPFIKPPHQDTHLEKKLMFRTFEQTSPNRNTTNQADQLEDNIFRSAENNIKVLRKKSCIKFSFKSQITKTFYEPNSTILYFFSKACTVQDLKQRSMCNIFVKFPKIIKCRLLQSGLMLLLVETHSLTENLMSNFDSSFERGFTTFDIKRERFEVPRELVGIQIIDFAIMDDKLLVLTGRRYIYF